MLAIKTYSMNRGKNVFLVENNCCSVLSSTALIRKGDEVHTVYCDESRDLHRYDGLPGSKQPVLDNVILV